MQMVKSGIYEIVNTADGKRYVGSALNLKERWRTHLKEITRGRHHNQHLQRAWIKHGAAAFRFSPLVFCGKKDLLFYEQICIDGLRPEYNVCRIAGSSLGVKQSPEFSAKLAARVPSAETRAKLSAAARLRTYSAEHMAKMTAAGRLHPLSPEARARVAAAHKGKIVSAETRAKMRVAAVERMKSPDARKKISMARTGRKASLGARAKMSAAGIGNKNALNPSAETREKLSIIAKARRASPETRAKMSAARIGKTYALGSKGNAQAARQARWRAIKEEKQCSLF